MLDEAHERTIHTDVLLGLLKKTVQKILDLLEAKKAVMKPACDCGLTWCITLFDYER